MLALPGLLVADDGAEHVPGRGIDAARKRPAAAEPITALHAPRTAARENQGRADQAVGRFAPDFMLRLGVPHADQPMVSSQVGQHPGGRAAALADHRGQLEQRAKRQLAAADARRLQHPEEAARMQIGDRLVRQAAQLFRPRGALAEHRDQRLGARQELVEARRRLLIDLRLRHCDPLSDKPACPSLLVAPQLGEILSTSSLDPVENGSDHRHPRPCRAGQSDRDPAHRAAIQRSLWRGCSSRVTSRGFRVSPSSSRMAAARCPTRSAGFAATGRSMPTIPIRSTAFAALF